MNDEQQAPVVASDQHKLGTFVRRHPMLSILGVGGVALIGGGELAAGVLIGAGIDSLLRRRRTAENAPEAQRLRERSRGLIERVPHVVRERTRAVFDAARGKQSRAEQPQGEPTASEQAAVEQQAAQVQEPRGASPGPTM